MNRVIYNIGWQGMSSGNLSWYPASMDCTFSEFAKSLRDVEAIEDLFNYAKKAHVPPASIVLMLLIDTETHYWEYTIKMINVREYRAHWESVYNKKWKES